MANILQINSRKGLVQLSHDELAEFNLLKWIRTSFRGIGRSGFIEETPFEKVAAELYVQKYPDTQVDMAIKCSLEKDDSVSILLRTYSTKDRQYNTAENEIVITKHETKQAKFFHRERKKKFNSLKKEQPKIAIYTGDFGGGQVQVLTPTTTEAGEHSYIVGTGASKDIVTIDKTKDGQPLINGWPDVKGVDIYPGDIVLLISDFSGFVGHSNLRSPEMPSYEKLISEPEGMLYSKFPASRSYLSDFDKTMVLLDLTSRRKGDIDYTRIFIDDEVWGTKYRDRINELLYGQFNFNSYLDFVSFLNDINFSSTSSNINTDNSQVKQIADKYDKKNLFSNLLNEIDLKDTYINHVPSVMQLMVNPKNSDKLKTVTMSKVAVPAYLKDALNTIFTSSNNEDEVEAVPFEVLLSAIQEKFVDSNLKQNYEAVNLQFSTVMLNQELKYILKYLYDEDVKLKKDVNQSSGESIDFNSLLNPKNLLYVNTSEDFTGYILNNYPELSSNNEDVLNYNKVLNYLIDKNVISSIEEVEEIRQGFKSVVKEQESVLKILNVFSSINKDSINNQESLNTLQGLIDFLVNFDKVHSQQFKVYNTDFNLDNKSELKEITFEETPFKFIDYYIKNFSDIYHQENERKYIAFNAIPSSQKESALESIGYGKEPMSIEEFMTRCPEARDYENLWLTNWTNAPAEEKARRLKDAFALDVDINPDFSNTLLGDQQSGLRGLNKGKEKALLDFHKYKMENEGAQEPLNLVTTDKDNPDQYKKSKQEFNEWLKNYNKSLKTNVDTMYQQRDQAQQELNNLDENIPNYKEQVDYRKKMINYYNDKIKEAEDASTTSWEDYINFSSEEDKEGTVEGKQGNEKRQLVKVLGFTTYNDLTLPDNYDRISNYVKDYIIDSYQLDPQHDSSDIDKLLEAEIGHLRLESIKQYLQQDFSDSTSSNNSTNVEGVPLSYEAFRNTINKLYSKLGITNPSEITNPEQLANIVEQGKLNKIISQKEVTYLNNLIKAATSYVNKIKQEYELSLQEINKELSLYDESNLTEDNANNVNQLITSKEEVEKELFNIEDIYSYIFSTIPEEIISQYSLLQIDPNFLQSINTVEQMNQNALEDKAPSRTANIKVAAEENILSKLDSAYSNYLVRPEVLDFIQKRLPTIGMEKDYKDLISEIAPEIQKEFITQYVEQNPEIFGKGFIEDQDFDASANNQEIWAVVSLLNPSFNSKGEGKDTKAGLYLVTTEQLLKIDADKIDQFYSNEIQTINKANPAFSKDALTPYFSSDKEKHNYNINSYEKALKDYKETDSAIKSKGLEPEQLGEDKFKSSPVDNFKSQISSYRKELENLPSVKKDQDRLEEVNLELSSNNLDEQTKQKLENEKQILTDYIEPIEKKRKLYEKKIQEAQKNISNAKPNYSVEDQIKDKTVKLNKDIEDFNKIALKYKEMQNNTNSSPEELARYKNILLKRKEMITTQQNIIKDMKESNIKSETNNTDIAKNFTDDNSNLEQEKLERRKQLQPKRYQKYNKPITKIAAIRSYRKIYWINNILNIAEASILDSYIKTASSVSEENNKDELIDILKLAVDNLDQDSEDNVILELCEQIISDLEKPSNLYETYTPEKGINTFKEKGVGWDSYDSLSNKNQKIESFESILKDSINKLSSYAGEGNVINTNQQTTTDMLDKDLETEEPTSNDISSITDKRVSKNNSLNRYADDVEEEGDSDGE